MILRKLARLCPRFRVWYFRYLLWRVVRENKHLLADRRMDD